MSGSSTNSTAHLLIGGFGEGFASVRFDTAQGHIVPESQVDNPAVAPSWLVYEPARQLLFAVSEQASGQPQPAGKVASYLRDDAAGRFQRLSEQDTGGDEPTHAILSPDGRYLCVANYASTPDPGGSLAVLPVAADGTMQPLSQRLTHPASGVNAERQASSHVHGATWSPDGRQLLVVDLGADRVYSYDYRPELDAAQPLQPSAVPYVALPPGSGPRHLVFSADGRHAYLVLEMASQLAHLRYADGALQLVASHPLADAGFSGRRSGGAIHLSPDGRFLYVSDRGEHNQLAVFALSAGGEPQWRQFRTSEGREPREFAFSPDGRFVLVANKHADEVVVLARDTASGLLGECLQRLRFTGPSILLFLPD